MLLANFADAASSHLDGPGGIIFIVGTADAAELRTSHAMGRMIAPEDLRHDPVLESVIPIRLGVDHLIRQPPARSPAIWFLPGVPFAP